MTWVIDLCVGFDKVAEVEALAEFRGVVRHLQPGSWRLDASVAGLGGADIDALDSIKVWDGTSVVFAGFITPAGTGTGGVTDTNTGNGRRVVLEGVDVWEVLRRKRAFPDPATEAPWATDYDVRSGVASTVAAGFIRDNTGSTALAGRQTAGLTIVDAGAGTSSTWSGRFQPLDELVARICRDGGITCRPLVLADGTIEVRLDAASDLSATIVLSDQGDLTDTTRIRLPAAATWLLGAGQGVGTARAFAMVDNGATGLNRIETVYENTNITTAAELALATAAVAADSAESTTVTTRLGVDAAQRFGYLVDYQVGDVASVEIDNVRYPVRVEAVSILVDAGRQVVTPTFGAASSNRASGLLRDVANLASRFENNIA